MLRFPTHISGPFYEHGLILLPTWISNHILYDIWDEITYPFPNFNGWLRIYLIIETHKNWLQYILLYSDNY